ncbi:MAG: hypothetical protein CMD69_02735 [Gammaproteobacteria bacterium]|nr:hypothetical protein [Gammaproteobacteria bacterium]|tara:strand:- start:183 stop:875 length:693 start_codon:yes stop_codon:yes gene_type:complete
MKKLLTVLLLISSFSVFSAHHEEAETTEKEHTYAFAYNSTFSIPAGSQPQRVEKQVLDNLATLEENGYYNCGLLRHQFGGERAYYSYCYFDSWEHFGEINDSNSAAAREPVQLYGDHTDHLVAILERNMSSKRTPYVLRATYTFGPFLTANEMRDRARLLFDAYNRAFEGCVLAEHAWGPELAWYFYCGYDSYADFAKKSSVLMEIHESELADAKTDIRNHSDDLMVRVK